MIHAFEAETPLPQSEHELVGLYRSTLHARRVLVVFDNAAGTDQVALLLPPAGSLAIITSRHQFDLAGLIPHNLDALSQEEAEQILLAVAPRIAEEAAALARLCGRLPLALRLAGSVLARRLDVSPREYRQDLEEGKERLEEVDGQLELSWRFLESDELRERFAQLGVFAGSFDRAAMTAVWGGEPAEAKKTLGELLGASLLDWSKERYRLHDLVGDFARRRQANAEEARKRHAAHYGEVLAAINERYLRAGTETFEALKEFDREWKNVQAGKDWAAQHAAKSDEAASVALRYALGGEDVLLLRTAGRLRADWFRRALAVSRRALGEQHPSSLTLMNKLAWTLGELGEVLEARYLQERALAVSRRVLGEEHLNTLMSMNNLAWMLRDLGSCPNRGIFRNRRWR